MIHALATHQKKDEFLSKCENPTSGHKVILRDKLCCPNNTPPQLSKPQTLEHQKPQR
jgi:hypothetical protein